MTFSSKLAEPLARTVKVDFCLLLRETMPSQRADVWAKADREGKRTSIAASNNVTRCFTMESAPLATRDFVFDLKNGSIVHPFSPLLGCSNSRGQRGALGDCWRNIPFTLINERAYSPLRSPIWMLGRVLPVGVFAGFERSLHEAHQLFGWGRIGDGRGAVRVGEPDVERAGQFERRHGAAANRTEGRAGMASDPGAAHPAAGRREREAYAIG